MGAVYVAEQLATKKQRALKIMRPELVTSERLRERFIQEAQIGSRVESDHIVDVIDAGIDPATGTPWLAMELLKGRTLADRIEQQGPMRPSVARELFSQLRQAVGAAHDVGIVHRDLKPDNIFLVQSQRDDGAGVKVKVLDFGIAKLVSEATTRSTGAIGTPLFMPPEQMSPGRSITPAADVWALGLIAFYVLTGRPYWQSGNQENSSAMMLLNEVLNLPIVPPSTRLEELSVEGRLPAGFDDWFLECVHRVIEDRHANASQSLGALEPLLAAAEDSTSPARYFVERPREVQRTIAREPADAISAGDTVAAETVDVPARKAISSSLASGETVFAGHRTTGGEASAKDSVAKAASPMRAIVIAACAVAGLSAILFWKRPHPPMTPSASPPATASSPAAASASAPGLPAMDAIVRLATLDLETAHDRLIQLPSSAPELADPRAAMIVAQWAKSVFERSSIEGPVVPRRHSLTRVVNDRLATDAIRDEAFDRLSALEPRTVTDKTRHYVFVVAGPKTDPDLARYGRASIVTELALRPDVVVASMVVSGYESDRVADENKLRPIRLEYEVTSVYGPHGLEVTVTGNYYSHPDRKALGNETSIQTRNVLVKDIAAERDLTLIGAQRIALSLAKAKNPTPPPPKTPSAKAAPACNCAPGDPLCSCY
jgi:serine/threonine protein kinase